MRASSRKLGNSRSPQAEALIVIPVLYQLPTDAKGIKVPDRWTRWGKAWLSFNAVGDPFHGVKWLLRFHGLDEMEADRLSLPAKHDIHPFFLQKDLLSMESGVNTAINGNNMGECPLDCLEHLYADRVRRGGTGMTGHHHVRRKATYFF